MDVEYNITTDKAARAVVVGETTPSITFEEADPRIEDLRTWPQLRHTPPNKLENIRKLGNLKAGIRKKLKHTNKTVAAKKVFGRLLKDQGTREQTLGYMHSHNPHTKLDATHMKKPRDHTCTDARRETSHKE
jgi:hypothetical protein